VVKTVEVGHIFKLGYKYSDSMGLRVLNADGKEVTPIMGSYGIGIERILTCAIELYHDKDGMILPPSIAPFDVVITPANNSDAAQMETARKIYESCLALGLDTLLDDRDERPGVKFKDADLIGVPWRVVVGKKLASGMVELVERKTRRSTDVAVDQAAAAVKAKLA
jgi:prolyl-tRNA synthetase